MDWSAFVEEIDTKIEAIWMQAPEDVRRLELGVVDSGAGTHGAALNAFWFVQSEVRGLTINACQALLVCAAQDMFTLEHLKVEARAHLSGRSGLLHYLGLPELGELFLRFLGHLEELPSKEEFVRVLRALKTYGARVHMWTLHAFPWHLGLAFPRRTNKEAAALQGLLEGPDWTPVRYSGR